MPPTIKDVAKKAGVSIATVSLVINKSNRISPETTRKVLKIIKVLNYHPSRSARGLVSKKTGNIVFILTSDHFLRTEPFYTKIFLGTEFEASQIKYYILLATISSDYKKEDSLPRFILERSVDGIILAGKIPNQFIENLLPYNLPIVMVDYYPVKGDFPLVLIDNIKGGMVATQHLINLGHKNIGFIGGDINHPSLADRLQGFKLAFNNAAIPFSENQIITDEKNTDKQSGYSAAQKLFSQRKDITAVFAGNDAMAIGVMQYLMDKNYKIPGDVSVIGFDDIETNILFKPPLSTIRVPKIQLGIEAVKLIDSIIKGENSGNKKILVPIELIERKSTKRLAKK